MPALLPARFPAVNNKLSSLRGPAEKPRGRHPNPNSSQGTAGERVPKIPHPTAKTNEPHGSSPSRSSCTTSPRAVGTWHEARGRGATKQLLHEPCGPTGAGGDEDSGPAGLDLHDFCPSRGWKSPGTPQRAGEHQHRNNSNFIQAPAPRAQRSCALAPPRSLPPGHLQQLQVQIPLHIPSLGRAPRRCWMSRGDAVSWGCPGRGRSSQEGRLVTG